MTHPSIAPPRICERTLSDNLLRTIFLPFQVQVGPPSCSCSWSWARLIFGSWFFANPTASFQFCKCAGLRSSSILVTLHYSGQFLPSSTNPLPFSLQQTRFIIQATKHDSPSVKPRLHYRSHFLQWLRSHLRRKANRPVRISSRSLLMVSKPLRFAPPLPGFHGLWQPTPTCECCLFACDLESASSQLSLPSLMPPAQALVLV